MVETANPSLERLKGLSFADFLGRYSSKAYTSPILGFGSVFTVTTEPTYPEKLNEITVRGGIHVAVAGGLDPALAQIGHAVPDFTILCDVNMHAIHLLNQRLILLDQAESGREYWSLLSRLIKNDPRLSFNLPTVVSDRDYKVGGWSSEQYFDIVKNSWQQGKIKHIRADITSDGIETALKVAQDTGIPIKLIYLSNIFDEPSNRLHLTAFRSVLDRAISEGLLDPSAQMVTTSIYEGMETKVLSVK